MSRPLIVSLLAAAWLSAPRYLLLCGGWSEAAGGFCDNGKVSVHRDLPVDAGWTCPHPPWTPDPQNHASSVDTFYHPQPSGEVCMDRPIRYEHPIPHSGPYRPIGAESGQYLYCPPQRWVNNLHQGAVVLLYHPCSPLSQRSRLSALAHTCLSDYVMTSHWGLHRDKPVALVSWGRTLELTSVSSSAVCDWLEETAGGGPGNHGNQGSRKYDLLLLQRSAPIGRGGGAGHAPLDKDRPPDTVRRCCENILSPLLDQRMRRSLNITMSSASNQSLLLHQEAHRNNLHQEAHDTDLHQEAHSTDLHQEVHNAELHQEAHSNNLHQEAHNTDLHQEAHNTDLHQEAHKTDLHQEAHENNLHQEAHKTELQQVAHNNNLHQEAHGNNLHQEAHENNLLQEAHSAEVTSSADSHLSHQDQTPGPQAASPGPPVGPRTADLSRSSSAPRGGGASETDRRRDKDAAQHNTTTETKAAGDKRARENVSHRHNVTRKTDGQTEEKSLLDVTEREAEEKRTHGHAHGAVRVAVRGQVRADAPHPRSKTRKSSTTSPPPPHTPPPKWSSWPAEGAPSSSSSRTPRTDEAVWAAAALGFLLVLLALSVLQTRLYRLWRTTPSLYWRDPRLDYDSVADVIDRRIRMTDRKRKRRTSRGRRPECVLLPASSSEDDSQ